jgi:hypothetical protein
MGKTKLRPPAKKPVAVEIELELPDDGDNEPMEGPEPMPRIDRRHTPRTTYEMTAWLSPADDTGALRRPNIRTRDLNPRGLGFRARQDVSALGEAILRLPAATGRYIAVSCRVRRSLELGNGWFDGLLEFLTPQPDLAHRYAQLCAKSAAKTSHNTRPKSRVRK